MVKPVNAEPSARRNDQMPFFLLTPPLRPRIGQLLQRKMESQVEPHTQRMTTWQPSTRAPRRKEKHGLDGFLPHHRPKQRTPRNPLRLLEALVKGHARRPVPRADFRRHGENGSEAPRRAFLEGLVGVVRGVEQRDE